MNLASNRDKFLANAQKHIEKGNLSRAIKEFGKVLEMRLHELGVFHHSQLADLEGYDFNWLAAKLGFSPDRLQELDWVGQSQRLVAEAQGEDFETLPGVEPSLSEPGEA